MDVQSFKSVYRLEEVYVQFILLPLINYLTKKGSEVNIIQSIFYKPKPISQIIIHSQRQYGQPKLTKPKELKGIKQSFSVDWIHKKCRCPCFLHNDDLYIQNRDFNSIDIYNSNHEFRRKFIYNDSFGCEVLRGEAWILIKDFMLDIKNNVFEVTLFQYLAKQITGEVGSCEWERFFEKIIKETKKVKCYKEKI